MKSKTILLTSLSIILILSATILATLAQTRTVGVSTSDWFTHGEISVEWSTNDTSATFPPSYASWLGDLNQTEWMRTIIQGITGTNVSAQFTEHFKNGTERTRPGWIDIDTGEATSETNTTADATFLLISANLETNDTLYTTSGFTQLRINETITRGYPGGPRNTNHLNLTYEYVYTNGQTMTLRQTVNYYWDTTTGTLVELTIQATNQTGQYLTTWLATSKISDSNIWTIPEHTPLTTLLALTALATLTTTLAITHKKLKQKQHTTA
jgi:opacity protein-like surface antigen